MIVGISEESVTSDNTAFLLRVFAIDHEEERVIRQKFG